MIAGILARIVTTSLGRWALGGAVALLLGGGAIMWHNHKEGLIEQGVQECVQEINQATIAVLENALADEKQANADLAAQLKLADQENALVADRRRELETSITALAKEMEIQKNEDPEYREWSNTALPGGVTDRLRQAAGSETGSRN